MRKSIALRTIFRLTIILILLTSILSADCQSSTLCLERSILENVATKLDSFSALKELQPFYESRYNTCLSLNKTQSQVISYQEQLLENKKIQINKFQSIEVKYKETLIVDKTQIQDLLKKNRKQKTLNRITLIGGGALTIGLSAALLISLL